MVPQKNGGNKVEGVTTAPGYLRASSPEFAMTAPRVLVTGARS